MFRPSYIGLAPKKELYRQILMKSIEIKRDILDIVAIFKYNGRTLA